VAPSGIPGRRTPRRAASTGLRSTRGSPTWTVDPIPDSDLGGSTVPGGWRRSAFDLGRSSGIVDPIRAQSRIIGNSGGPQKRLDADLRALQPIAVITSASTAIAANSSVRYEIE
jgi:hypothetical protein